MRGWLSKVSVNERYVKNLEELESHNEAMKELTANAGADGIGADGDDKKGGDPQDQQVISTKQSRARKIPRLPKGQMEVGWYMKAVIVYFQLHPLLGNKDIFKTKKMFKDLKISPVTILNWIRKRQFRKRWVPLVAKFTLDKVLASLPKSSYSGKIKALVSRLATSPHSKRKLDLSIYQVHAKSLSTNSTLVQAGNFGKARDCRELLWCW
jgi:hypothetical protein